MRPRRNRGRAAHLLRAYVAAVLLLGAAGLVLAGTAGADAFTPEAGPTQNAVDTDTLYKIVFSIALVVVGLVWAILFYSLFRFRARRGRQAPQIRGNSALELAWTAGASAIVVTVALITFLFLNDIKNPPPSGTTDLAEASTQHAALGQPPPGGRSLDIEVSGQQYVWRYRYPNGAVAFHEMVVPKDTTVTLKITSNDVAHSWWIPELGGKFDAIPGLTNKTWFKATRTGTFEGRCAELCGANHAFMTAKVTVVEPAAYVRWVERQKRLVEDARGAGEREKRRLQGKAGP